MPNVPEVSVQVVSEGGRQKLWYLWYHQSFPKEHGPFCYHVPSVGEHYTDSNMHVV